LADGTLNHNNTELQTIPTIPRQVRYIRFWVDSNWGTYGGGLRQVIIYESTSDGYGDACDNCPDVFNTDQADFDNDGDGDACDTDDDNDGTLDTDDAFPLNPNEDTDTDSDGIGNNADTDDDGDGTLDTDDDFPSDPTEDTDTDGDGTGNNADTDDDNDGISDADEDSTGTDPLDTDTDDDGTLDPDDTFPLDPNEDTDSDEDGVGDNADADDDNDSFGDVDEISAGSDPLSALSVPNDFIDSDGDGIGDSQDNCPDEPNADQADSDALAVSNETNIAAGKNTSASSTYSNSFPSSKIVDGNTSDGSGYWLAEDGLTDQWVQVDLGDEYQISRIQWFNTSNGTFNDSGVYTYRIVGSRSNNNWSLPSEVVTLSEGEVAEGNFPTSPYIVEISPKKTVRYVRFYCDDIRSGDVRVGLNELEVFELKSDGGDVCDNCPDIYNLDQSDVDGDGYGDVCDAFPNDENEWLDTDSDNIGNNADTDDDGDGLTDVFEIAEGTDPLDSTDYVAGSITVVESFTNFEACYGTNSAEQSFTVEAYAITDDLVLDAPANFVISQSSGGTFSDQITLTPSSDNELEATTIYVRSIATPLTGTYTEALSYSTTQAAGEALTETTDFDADIQLAGTTLTLGYNQATNYDNTPNFTVVDGIQWIEWSSISGDSGTGTLPSGRTVNGVASTGTGVTLDHSVGGMSGANTFGYNNYPQEFNVPNTANTIKNTLAGTFTVTFASAVTNPQIALGSIGNVNTAVPIQTSIPYQVLWAGIDVTFDSPTQFTGTEGFVIVSFPGTHTSITFTYLTSENWVNIHIGAESLESDDVNICEGEEITLNANGGDGANYLWSADVSGTQAGLPSDLTTSSIIVNPMVTTTYTVNNINDYCGAQKSITVIVPDVDPVAVTLASLTIDLDADGTRTLLADEIDNGSYDDCIIDTKTINISEFDCDDVGTTQSITLTVTDLLGNTSTSTTQVTIQDIDSDEDGTDNCQDAFPLDPTEDTDTDGDGTGDNADTDDDGDGTPDADDAFPLDPTEDTDTDGDGTGDNADTDDDGDGTPDADDAFPLDPTEDTDTDGDGTGDNADTDDDGDGTPDADDAFPLDPTEDTDTDGDGTGDNADTDDDGDGTPDADDAFPLDPTEDTDTDGDGTGDNADTDDDGDGTPDADDAFPLDPTEDTDTDGDGTGDNADTDDDGDGTPDADDAFPLDPTEDTDTDGDGTGDNAEGYDSVDPSSSTNSDNDGVPDYLEDNTSDEDDDGTPDHQDPDNDTDGDGYSNIDELNGGSDPLDPDSTLNIDVYEETISFLIYPNPVKDILRFKTEIIESLDVNVFDFTGKRVLYKSIGLERELDLSHLDSAVYFIKIESKTSSEIFHIVKE
jgi:hypothetical protein